MGAISTEALRRLEIGSACAAAGDVGKLLSSPVRLGCSRILEKWCAAGGRTVHRVAPTFWGEPMHLVFPDPVSMSIYRYGLFEDSLTRAFLALLRPGAVFFDVGAHIGYFAMFALWLVGPGGHVAAFEPTPRTRAILARNIGGRPNAAIVPMAAYRRRATLTLRDFGPRYSAYNSLYSGKLGVPGATPTEYQVPAMAIDEYVSLSGTVPHVLKIDAEGAEPDVLAGMEGLLTGRFGPGRPVVTLEVGDDGGPDIRPSRAAVETMCASGYAPYELRGADLVEHRTRDRYDYDNLVLLPR